MTVDYTATLRRLTQTPPHPPIAFCGHKIPTGVFKSDKFLSLSLHGAFEGQALASTAPDITDSTHHRRRGYPTANCVYINNITFLCNLSFFLSRRWPAHSFHHVLIKKFCHHSAASLSSFCWFSKTITHKIADHKIWLPHLPNQKKQLQSIGKVQLDWLLNTFKETTKLFVHLIPACGQR